MLDLRCSCGQKGLSFLPNPLVPRSVHTLRSSKSDLLDSSFGSPVGRKPAAGEWRALWVDSELDSDSDVDSDVDSDSDSDFDSDFAFDFAFDFYRRHESPLCCRSVSQFSHRDWSPLQQLPVWASSQKLPGAHYLGWLQWFSWSGF